MGEVYSTGQGLRVGLKLCELDRRPIRRFTHATLEPVTYTSRSQSNFGAHYLNLDLDPRSSPDPRSSSTSSP